MTVPAVWVVLPLTLLMTAAAMVPIWIGLCWIERRIGDWYLRRAGYLDRADFECQSWNAAGREVQEECPICFHLGLHHYLLDGCYACKNERERSLPTALSAVDNGER